MNCELCSSQVDDRMVSDLSRKSEENKKLKELLSVVWNSYNSLSTHVKKITQEKEEFESSPKKRKRDDTVQQSSWKRPTEELPISPISGIKRVYVKVDPSDKSLVIYQIFCSFLNKINLRIES